MSDDEEDWPWWDRSQDDVGWHWNGWKFAAIGFGLVSWAAVIRAIWWLLNR
jgi:hypothetical protein